MKNTSPQHKDTTSPNEQKNIGPIIGTLTIIVILIGAAIYLFASRINQQSALRAQLEQTQAPTNAPNAITGTTSNSQVAPISNSSDKSAALQKDLNNALGGLDKQVK